MRAKQLLEKLNDLATFLALASAEADHEQGKDFNLYADFHKGEKKAYNIAFNKVDGIIKEAKK